MTGFDDRTREAARRAYRLFEQDPEHPSLRFKKLGGYDRVWSVRISAQYRAVGERHGDSISWAWLSPLPRLANSIRISCWTRCAVTFSSPLRKKSCPSCSRRIITHLFRSRPPIGHTVYGQRNIDVNYRQRDALGQVVVERFGSNRVRALFGNQIFTNSNVDDSDIK